MLKSWIRRSGIGSIIKTSRNFVSVCFNKRTLKLKLKSFIFKLRYFFTKIDRASDQDVKKLHSMHKLAIENNKKVVLMLSLFPFKNAKFGGQIRSNAAYQGYHKLGLVIPFIVRPIDWYVNESIAIDEVVFPLISPYRLYGCAEYIPYSGDFLAGIFAKNDPKVIKAIKRRIKFPVDIIHVEHPWLFPFVYKLKKEFAMTQNATLIYSAQNIEWALNEQMLNGSNLDQNIIKKLVQDIRELELFTINHADLVVTVSPADQAYLEQQTIKKVIYAPNATHKKIPDDNKVVSWKQRLPAKFFLFAGSDHPPNSIGLHTCLNGIDKNFTEEFKVVILGSVINSINQYPLFSNSNFIKLGFVEPEDLAAIIFCAHAVLVPITIGGGTNLKTAEALLSGKYVVATKFGMRGYEHYIGHEGVYVSESPSEFQNDMRKVWQLPKPSFENFRAQDLTWEYSMQPLFRSIQ
ncbi:MAG: glycosyltransferase [Proteobacteria bacterium]|nr:glycosyltransferase [Pseudomonadota bacterium]